MSTDYLFSPHRYSENVIPFIRNVQSYCAFALCVSLQVINILTYSSANILDLHFDISTLKTA